MNLDFAALLLGLGRDFAFQIANAARAPGDYLFATLLPEQNRFSYHVQTGTMTIRATMAGLAAMDSPYPPGGMIDSSKFAEQTIKIANEIPLSEQALRTLQDMMLRLGNSAPTNDVLINNLLNFVQKVIVQPHLDTAEWLRSRALVTGLLQWTFGDIIVNVNYNIPADNKLTARVGADGYGGNASKFWVDDRAARRILKRGRARIANPETIDMIRYNTANEVVTVSDEGSSVIELRRVLSDGSNFTRDRGDVVRFISYDKEAEILDPDNPGQTITIPFMPTGKVLWIGDNVVNGFNIGVDQGSTQDPALNNRLGFTHIAPTVEGGGRPGRWANVFTPQNEPYKIHGRGVTNLLPVIEAPNKIVIGTTDMV